MGTTVEHFDEMLQVAMDEAGTAPYTDEGFVFIAPGELHDYDPTEPSIIFRHQSSPDLPAGMSGRTDSGGEGVLHMINGFVQMEFRTPMGNPADFYTMRDLAHRMKVVYRQERTTIRYRNVSVIERDAATSYYRIDVQFEYEFYETTS